MYTLINPSSWPQLDGIITDQAYLLLDIDRQVLYESCAEAAAERGTPETGFLLDQGMNNPGVGINLEDQ